MGGGARGAVDLVAVDGLLVGEEEGKRADPEGGEEEVIAAGHFADDEEGGEGSFGGGGRKKPAMPMMTKAAGWGAMAGQRLWRKMPMAPPPHPPMTMEGPKTPPEPPEPMVRPVVRIFPREMTRRRKAKAVLASRSGSMVRACWRIP